MIKVVNIMSGCCLIIHVHDIYLLVNKAVNTVSVCYVVKTRSGNMSVSEQSCEYSVSLLRSEDAFTKYVCQ